MSLERELQAALEEKERAFKSEQPWCPMKHGHRIRSPHSRYPHFLDYGDAQRYREQIETVRSDFVDLRSMMPAPAISNTDNGVK